MARSAQLGLPFPATWGGARKGAGRPVTAGRRRATPHRARPEHKARFPLHVTMRARAEVPSFRSPRAFAAIRSALANATKPSFRVVHFSAQSDHLHLIVEGADKDQLSRGVRGLAIRVARQFNRAVARRGPVWGDRYHARALTTPREVRHGLVYVLMNFKKHRPGDASRLDACSSAPWFDGFKQGIADPVAPPPVSRPRTWLASLGWRRHGLISLGESPCVHDSTHG
jgi:REP element-mobilizing transposase RayT